MRARLLAATLLGRAAALRCRLLPAGRDLPREEKFVSQQLSAQAWCQGAPASDLNLRVFKFSLSDPYSVLVN